MSVGDHYPEPRFEPREFTMNPVEARNPPIMRAPDGARVAALEARAKVAEEKLESVEAHFKTMHIQYDRLAGDVRWLKSRIEDLEASQSDRPARERQREIAARLRSLADEIDEVTHE